MRSSLLDSCTSVSSQQKELDETLIGSPKDAQYPCSWLADDGILWNYDYFPTLYCSDPAGTQPTLIDFTMTGMPVTKARTFIVLIVPSTQLDTSIQQLTLSYQDSQGNWPANGTLINLAEPLNAVYTVDPIVQITGVRIVIKTVS